MNYFEGKKIWLTGASTGIGEAVALELASRGAVLALTSRRPEPLAALGAKISSNHGKVLCLTGDVTNRDDMHRIAREIESKLGPIDIVIANAGTHLPSNPSHFNADEYLSIMNTNYGGTLRTLEPVVPSMVARRSGCIVGISSLAGFRGMPTAAAYSASKSALTSFLESIRFQLAEVGVSVLIVHPGFVRTPLTDKNNFYMPFLMEAPAAAKIICDGIAKQKKEISFPIPFNWMMKFVRIIPYPLYEILARILWKLSERR